jgi:hypothetical protein
VRASRLAVLLAAAALLSSAGGSASSSRAAANESCRWRAAAVEDPHAQLFDRFDSVTVTSSGDAWAVGDYYSGREGGPNGAFIERWTGRRWTLAAKPLPDADLWSVSASGAADVWAVGDHLVEHWDGRRLSRVATPHVRGSSIFRGVAARGPRDAWLVGERWRGAGDEAETLVEHWNGERWRVVPTPNPPPVRGRGQAPLQAVTARSASDAWAVGYRLSGRHLLVSRPLIEHWDGHRWRIVPSPGVRASKDVLYDILFAVTADRPDDAWAVGSSESYAGGYGGKGDRALVLHWNGRRWSRSALPGVGERTLLAGVVARAGDVWAVGDRGLPPRRDRALVERWDGTRWTVAPSPGGFDLAAAAAQPHGTAWAVGAVGRGPLAARLVCG